MGKAICEEFVLASFLSCLQGEIFCIRSRYDYCRFWGIEKVLPLFDDDRGCSAVIIHTEKAKMQFQRLNCDKLKVDIVDIIAGNSAIVKSWKASPNRERFLRKYQKDALLLKQ